MVAGDQEKEESISNASTLGSDSVDLQAEKAGEKDKDCRDTNQTTGTKEESEGVLLGGCSSKDLQ